MFENKNLITMDRFCCLTNSIFSSQDTFFYSLVYDPQQKTLLADKGEIRVGSKFQAETIPKVIAGWSKNTL